MTNQVGIQDEPTHGAEQPTPSPRRVIPEFLDFVLRGYSGILFSSKVLPALLFMTATFVDPTIGVLGLAGNAIANLVAIVAHTDRAFIRAGIFGINGTLVGLGIGLYIDFGMQAIAFLITGSILAAILTIILISILTHRRGLPVMSVPFVITMWCLLLALHAISPGTITPRINLHPVAAIANTAISEFVPDTLQALMREFGSTLFQPFELSGLLVLIGVLLTSRISFAFGLLGALAGVLVFHWIGGTVTSGDIIPYGLNYVLIAIALGGFLIAPTLAGGFYATLGVAIGVLIAHALGGLLKPYDLPPLVAPFNLTVLMLLYPLRTQVLYAARARIVPIPLAEIGTPEQNASWYNKRYGKRLRVQYRLPFYGTWQVMQGEFGTHTHKGTQAYAYDFIVVDEMKKPFRGLGLALEDYYTFGLPVLAPADGTVITATSHIHDNPPGVLNEAHNWGNFIILEHGEGEYTEISHLRQYSILVRPGDTVVQGQILGQCGNSGYSAHPHIHIQRQKGAFVGAETLPLRFTGVLIQSGDNLIPFNGKSLTEGMNVAPSGTSLR